MLEEEKVAAALVRRGGLYTHYKGGGYKVLGLLDPERPTPLVTAQLLARHTETGNLFFLWSDPDTDLSQFVGRVALAHRSGSDADLVGLHVVYRVLAVGNLLSSLIWIRPLLGNAGFATSVLGPDGIAVPRFRLEMVRDGEG